MRILFWKQLNQRLEVILNLLSPLQGVSTNSMVSGPRQGGLFLGGRPQRSGLVITRLVLALLQGRAHGPPGEATKGTLVVVLR